MVFSDKVYHKVNRLCFQKTIESWRVDEGLRLSLNSDKVLMIERICKSFDVKFPR